MPHIGTSYSSRIAALRAFGVQAKSLIPCEVSENEVCMHMTRTITLGVVSLILILLPGCGKLMHEMQPHRLWRWNYQQQSGNSDGSYGAYFSLDDSLEKTQKPDRAYARKTR